MGHQHTQGLTLFRPYTTSLHLHRLQDNFLSHSKIQTYSPVHQPLKHQLDHFRVRVSTSRILVAFISRMGVDLASSEQCTSTQLTNKLPLGYTCFSATHLTSYMAGKKMRSTDRGGPSLRAESQKPMSTAIGSHPPLPYLVCCTRKRCGICECALDRHYNSV